MSIEFKEIFVELLEFPFGSASEEVEREIEFDSQYSHIAGISANVVSGHRAEVSKSQLDRREVLFAEGTSVEDVFATHPVAAVVDRFFPCELPIGKDDKFSLRLRDTTPSGFSAHTRKVYLLLVRK